MKVKQIGSRFDFAHNRSERALQAELLVPALADPAHRARLLTGLDVGNADPITPDEAQAATAMHFVWVLRDAFSWEQKQAKTTLAWHPLVERWATILGLPAWGRTPEWWRHPEGSYKGDPDFAVHPCQPGVGWTTSDKPGKGGIARRVAAFDLAPAPDRAVDVLVAARKVMNTESDCFVQTPSRLIIIECKDKTGFSTEQRSRQQRLGACLTRLLPRPNPPIFVDVARTSKGIQSVWKWADLEALRE